MWPWLRWPNVRIGRPWATAMAPAVIPLWGVWKRRLRSCRRLWGLRSGFGLGWLDTTSTCSSWARLIPHILWNQDSWQLSFRPGTALRHVPRCSLELKHWTWVTYNWRFHFLKVLNSFELLWTCFKVVDLNSFEFLALKSVDATGSHGTSRVRIWSSNRL